MTTETLNYRQIQAYANSDLSELLNLRMGKPLRPIDPKAARFGTTFHAMVLEPTQLNQYWDTHTPKEKDTLIEMYKALSQEALNWIRVWRREGNHEIERFWSCPTTGLPLKAKIDAAWPDSPGLFDLKTTSAKSANEFYDTFVEYGYDRQAAFYLDAFGVKYRFCFVGVQKQKPHEVFIINMAISEDRKAMIDQARIKNARLIRDAYNEFMKPDGWRPSSWSRKDIS